MGKRPSTPPEKYREAAARAGIAWLEDYPGNVDAKTLWRCSFGHEWSAPLTNIRIAIKKGFSGCPYCAGNSRKTEADYHALAAVRGWQWIGPYVAKTTHKTWWKCDKGHRVHRGYSFLLQSNCPLCSGVFKKTALEYQRVGIERGIFWLGIEPPEGVKETTSWYCKHCSHIWKTSYDGIRMGTGCPKCANERRRDAFRLRAEDYESLAAQMGFKWLGPLPENNNTKTWWECQSGHKWERDYTHTGRGYQCPKCSRRVNGRHTSRPQRIIAEMVGGEINTPVGTHFVDITLTVNGAQIAIEYDGWHWHGGREDIDRERDNLLIKGGWRVLKIKGNLLIPSLDVVQSAIQRLCSGETYVEILLDDWGQGITAQERFARKAA